MAVIELVREPHRQEGHRQGGRGRDQACGQARPRKEADEARRGRAETVEARSSETTTDRRRASAEGAVAANEDGSSPDEAYTIKGNVDSRKYHEPDGQWFEQTIAEFWFQTAEAAEAAGFTKAGA